VLDRAAPAVRQFVEHWGMMARAWGINPTMGELFALLYVTGSDWTADDLRLHLRVSRGNVSMNLRELIGWGVVHKIHRKGERREYFRAETEVWTLFRRILAERKRRELDPTIGLLGRLASEVSDDPALEGIRFRVESLRQFFGLVQSVALRIDDFDPSDLVMISRLLSPPDPEPK
jgi:DNA-binding transcriptional regulator GbsR (MarR family)